MSQTTHVLQYDTETATRSCHVLTQAMTGTAPLKACFSRYGTHFRTTGGPPRTPPCCLLRLRHGRVQDFDDGPQRAVGHQLLVFQLLVGHGAGVVLLEPFLDRLALVAVPATGVGAAQASAAPQDPCCAPLNALDFIPQHRVARQQTHLGFSKCYTKPVEASESAKDASIVPQHHGTGL